MQKSGIFKLKKLPNLNLGLLLAGILCCNAAFGVGNECARGVPWVRCI